MWLVASAALASPIHVAAGPAHVAGAAKLTARSTELQPAIDAAALEFAVPRDLLSALVWEASHYDPSVPRQWAGYGPMDLREDRDPKLESAAILLGESADLVLADPTENIRGGAALLADEATRANGGVAPDPDDLESWWDALRPFSGSQDPSLQRNFAAYVYQSVWYGVDATVVTGEHVRFGGVPVDLPGLLAAEGAPFPAIPDSPNAVDFVPACTSNYTADNRSGSDITYIVIHTMQGSYSGSISWFQNCAAEVSAHYCVRSSDGEITQMVREDDIAWHAGNWDYNVMSIGIEHEGYVEDPDTWYTDEMYQASADLVIDILSRTSVAMDRDHIIGHVEVPGATHTDPGDGWDWDYYMSLVEGSWVIAGDVTGVIAIDDVYTGDRIDGATVTVRETGETEVVGDDGVYRFEDLPEGAYTIDATAPGYLPASCATTVDATATFWCSLALTRDESGGGGGTTPPTGSTPDATDPTNPGVDGPPPSAAMSQRVAMERQGCGCAGSPAPAGGLLVLLMAVAARRRS